MATHSLEAHLKMLLRYKAWADEQIFRSVLRIPHEEAVRPRATRWANMLHTLNHVHVVDEIFRHHLEGRRHPYTSRNSEPTPTGPDLHAAVRATNQWYLGFAESCQASDSWDRTIEFEFVGGGRGVMTPAQIVLHVVNHGTYHRGMVSTMLHQVAAPPEINDLTVYLRDHEPRVSAVPSAGALGDI